MTQFEAGRVEAVRQFAGARAFGANREDALAAVSALAVRYLANAKVRPLRPETARARREFAAGFVAGARAL